MKKKNKNSQKKQATKRVNNFMIPYLKMMIKNKLKKILKIKNHNKSKTLKL